MCDFGGKNIQRYKLMKKEQKNEVKRFYQEIGEEKQIVLLTFDRPRVGVFDSEEAIDIALNKKSIQKVYTVLNELKEEAFDRLPQNELKLIKKGEGISATDINYYKYFLIDLDVVGLRTERGKRNATDDEHAEALNVARKVEEFLKTMNFPEPILIDSANGYHLLYKVHLKASQENERMLKNCLIVVGENVDTKKVKVDTVVFDRGRKLKLPGSLNNAEDDVGFRMSQIIKIPDEIQEVDVAVLKELEKLKKGNKKGWENSTIKEEKKDFVDLAEESGEFFVADNNRIYANVKREDGKIITVDIAGKEFKIFLRNAMRKNLKMKTIRSEDWREMLDYLYILANEKSSKKVIFNRIGKNENAILYDLCTDEYQSVEVTSDGWKLIDTPAGVFQRDSNDMGQVTPVYDEEFEFLETIMSLFNFSTEQDAKLFSIWLISAFIPEIAHPLLVFTGAHASGKSSACTMIQELISPRAIDRMAFPKKVDDLVISLSNHCISVFDNCSARRISEDASDILCQSVSGGVYTKRKLYSDMDTVTIPLKGMVVMNGCDSLVERPDLLSRVLQFNFTSIEGERLETDQNLMEEFRKAKPKLLGYIFQVLMRYVEEKNNVMVEKYVIRLTEFQQAAQVISEIVFGDEEENTIESLLDNNKNEMTIQLLEENPVAVLILKFMEYRKEWSGSVTELYDKLQETLMNVRMEKNNHLYPKHPAALSRKLNSIASSLKLAGITFHIKPDGICKRIYIYNKKFKEKPLVGGGTYYERKKAEKNKRKL